MSSRTEAGLSPEFEPDYAIAPGETILDWLEEADMTQRELAVRLGLSPKHVNQLVKGIVPLSADVAWRLERVTGMDTMLWLRLEADYRSTVERLEKRGSLISIGDWLTSMPISDLVTRGALPSTPADAASRAEQLLSFFGVASPKSWSELWTVRRAAFRQTKAFEIDEAAVAVWLRLGELAAMNQSCASFSASRLREALPVLRALTARPIDQFFAEARRICAEAGVALVVVEEIRGCRISGATHWPSKDRAILQLSLRYKKDDRVFFTFFHEIAHVLLHDHRDFRIEDDSSEDAEEREADAFAASTLIPVEHESRLAALRSLASMRDFARDLGIAPGVVVGRLQKDGQIGWGTGNVLKRTITLSDVGQ